MTAALPFEGMEKLKFGLVVYYDVRESLVGAVEALQRKIPARIVSFPLLQRLHESKDAAADVAAWVRREKLTVVLWWYLNLPPAQLQRVKSAAPDCRHYLYDWDQPHGWAALKPKLGFLDGAVVSSRTVAEDRLPGLVKYAGFAVPGCDPAVFFRPAGGTEEPDAVVLNDLVLCCTNLYASRAQFPHQGTVSRTRLLQLFAGQIDLYGPPQQFAAAFPQQYRAFCKYFDLGRMFRRYRLAVCTHVNAVDKAYLNERAAIILMSGGAVLFIDCIRGFEDILQDGVNCVVMQPQNLRSQVKRLLADPASLRRIAAAGVVTARRHFTWDVWADAVAKMILSEPK